MYAGKDGKTVYDVLNKEGDSVKKFGDAQSVMEYLHKNFDSLRKGEVQKENPETDQEMSMDYESQVTMARWHTAHCTTKL